MHFVLDVIGDKSGVKTDGEDGDETSETAATGEGVYCDTLETEATGGGDTDCDVRSKFIASETTGGRDTDCELSS